MHFVVEYEMLSTAREYVASRSAPDDSGAHKWVVVCLRNQLPWESRNGTWHFETARASRAICSVQSKKATENWDGPPPSDSLPQSLNGAAIEEVARGLSKIAIDAVFITPDPACNARGATQSLVQGTTYRTQNVGVSKRVSLEHESCHGQIDPHSVPNWFTYARFLVYPIEYSAAAAPWSETSHELAMATVVQEYEGHIKYHLGEGLEGKGQRISVQDTVTTADFKILGVDEYWYHAHDPSPEVTYRWTNRTRLKAWTDTMKNSKFVLDTSLTYPKQTECLVVLRRRMDYSVGAHKAGHKAAKIETSQSVAPRPIFLSTATPLTRPRDDISTTTLVFLFPTFNLRKGSFDTLDYTTCRALSDASARLLTLQSTVLHRNQHSRARSVPPTNTYLSTLVLALSRQPNAASAKMASTSFRESMNSLGWSRRDPDYPVSTSSQTGLLSSIKSLNPFGDRGYVQLPTTEGAGAPLPASNRRDEEEGWFVRESPSLVYVIEPWQFQTSFERCAWWSCMRIYRAPCFTMHMVKDPPEPRIG
ncbi:hypothetical protein CHU98_g3695 [Xylaria longipes]|nr:hypothetical protein CHU98_g3695 [Xylaria longipes]